jgi:phage terminase large subunit
VLDIRIADTVNTSFIDDFFKNKHRTIACYGGAAAGKSKATAQKNVLRSLLYDHERILVVRKHFLLSN